MHVVRVDCHEPNVFPKACSSDSTDGICGEVDTSCSAMNTCRTCDHSGNCYSLDIFPNTTIAEYGTYSYFTSFGSVAHKIKAEIYARGPVATGVNAEPIVDYDGGIVYDTHFWNMMVNHVVSIVGWDTDPATGEQYWIVRNSWVGWDGKNKCHDAIKGSRVSSFCTLSDYRDSIGEPWVIFTLSWERTPLVLNRRLL